MIIESDTSDCEDLEVKDSVNDMEGVPSLEKKITGIVVSFLLMFRVIYGISDRAIVLLLRFFNYFLKLIGNSYGLAQPEHTTHMPLTIKGCYSLLNLNPFPCKVYTVCPSCHLLYDFIDKHEHATCKFIEFPHHPQQRFRQPCNTVLFNKILKGNQSQLKPKKVYYYYGIEAALSVLLSRPNFLNYCNHWIDVERQENVFSDITDGLVWKEIVESCVAEGTNQSPRNILGLLLNIDWFQPFKHIAYSVGVIYDVIINLPRSIRFKEENVIILGVIPGPHEPIKHVNSYLGPFVNEMLKLKVGTWFDTPFGYQFLKCYVVCLSADIPATRKAAGFVGHHAQKACSRCLKSFQKVNDTLICGGFNRDSWKKRDHLTHCEKAREALAPQTIDARKKIERIYGSRYSILFELPLYDAIRYPVIDIMHNLFLGTSKHAMKIWKEHDILTKAEFSNIQKLVERIKVPMDIGRIPHKIEPAMAGLTADQWKHWTCIYSLYVLHGIIPKEHLDCWHLFVQACNIICLPILTNTLIDLADDLLLKFCGSFERLYGAEACTINLHLHCHLADCLRDYGPANSTWCFNFERYNGVLGKTPNNNRSLDIEKTMITRFIQQLEAKKTLTHFASDLEDFFPMSEMGTVGDAHHGSTNYKDLSQLSETQILTDLFKDTIQTDGLITSFGHMFQHTLKADEVLCLKEMYLSVFSTVGIVSNISCLCYKFRRAKLGNKLLSSSICKGDGASYICAKWNLTAQRTLDTQTERHG